MHREALLKAIKICGGQAALATEIGVDRRVVNNWLNRNKHIPFHYAILIEEITQREVCRYKLAPYVNSEQFKSQHKMIDVVDDVMSCLTFIHKDLSARINQVVQLTKSIIQKNDNSEKKNNVAKKKFKNEFIQTMRRKK